MSDRGKGAPDDEKRENERGSPDQAGASASIIRESSAARDALANQLSSNTPFQGARGQPSALDTLQLLRQGTGLLGASVNPNPNPALNSLSSGNPLLAALQGQAMMANPSAANLREARLFMLLQQQQQQQLNQQLMQQQQLNQRQQQQVQNQDLLAHLTRTRQQASNSFLSGSQASANINAQLAMRGLSALGGGAGERALNLALGDPNNLSSLLSGNLSNLASLPVNQASALSAPTQGEGNLAAAARMPEAQLPARPSEDDQPEMGDGDYFELFGFNDEDGVQIINETFPHKLYRMLFEVEKKGQEDIVSFFPHGKAFIVHQPKRFVDEIMPNYFSTSRMSSFQRQLNLYGFQRIDDGPEKGGFVHQYFQKGQRSLCNKIRRQRNKSQASAQPVQPDSQPGFARGSPQAMMQRGFAARGAGPAPGAAASLPAQMSMPQNQQAQFLLQQMLNQQQEEEKRSADSSPR